jgi:predicted ATPase
MPPDKAQPTRIFYCYAHEDEKFRRELQKNLALLRNQGLIEDWSDRDIPPGAEWDDEIDDRLRSADVILLLVSSAFISSKYIWGKELQLAVSRHQAGQARVIPVVLRPVVWDGAPFAKLQMLPPDAKPIIKWRPREDGWVAVTKSLDRLVRGLATRLPRERETRHRARWPRPLTPLVGRESECADVRQALVGHPGLVTLVGPMGVGKSHLALEVGADPDVSECFPDGIHRVDLATLTDPGLLESSIARELGVEETPGVPLWRKIADFLGDQQRLILLDGFDRVMPANQVVADLLQATSGLTIMVTSRGALGIPGESAIAVGPLEVPSLDPPDPLGVLGRRPAVQLFVERARSVQSTFALTRSNAATVARLCVEVSGLPLAIQLLASQIAVLPPVEILKRRATLVDQLDELISSSVELLDPDTARLFADLGAFAGGFTLEAAEAVARRDDVLTGLRGLLGASLVLLRTANDQYRYFMLTPVNEVAQRRLGEDAEGSVVLARHGRYYRELMEKAEEHVEGEQQDDCLATLEPENANFRAVLARSIAGTLELEEGLRLAGAMGPLWYVRGQFSEGRRWLTRLLDAPGAARPPVRAKATNFAGILAYHQNDYALARELLMDGLELFEQCLEDPVTTGLLRELGFTSNRSGRAKSLNGLGFVAKEEGSSEEARRYYEESLELYREIDDEWGIVWSATDLALVLLHVDEPHRAVDLLEESLQRQTPRLVRGRSGRALTIVYLAYALAAQGRRDAAGDRARQALDESRTIGYKRGVILAAQFTGLLEMAAGRRAQARALLREALALCREVGDRGGMADALEALAALAAEDGSLESAVQLRLVEQELRKGIHTHARRPEYDPVAAPAAVLARIDGAVVDARDDAPPTLDVVLDGVLGQV